MVVRQYQEELQYLEKLTDHSWRIKKGFQPNMKVESILYVNSTLEKLMLEELRNSCRPGQIGGFLSGVKQIANVAALPGIVERSVGLPDVHSGYGFAIAFDINDPKSIVSPGGAGFDIDCGLRLLRTNLFEKDVQPFKEPIAQSMSVGVGSKGIIPMKAQDLEEALEMGVDWPLREGYSWAEDKEHCEEYEKMLDADPSKSSTRAKKRGLPQGNNKPSTIHVNPMFKENSKSFIHINPHVHINMAIHVNPRMVNTFAHGQMQQRMMENGFINSRREKLQEDATSVQKSIYVNPKLMEKLTKSQELKIAGECSNDGLGKSQPQIQKCESVGNRGKLEVFGSKNSSPNLVSLSRRKLVRIRPVDDSDNSVEVVERVIAQKSLGKIEIRRIVKGSQLKRIYGTNQMKKVNVISVGNQGKGHSTLRKVNSNFSSGLKRINVGGFKKVNSVKVNSKSSASCSKTSGNKYKIDRTVGDGKIKAPVTRKTLGSNNKNLINIDGIFYRSSNSQLVKSNSAPKTPKKPTSPSSRAKKLRTHVVINGKIAKINTSNLRRTSLLNQGQKSNYKHVISNRVKQRSLQILRHKMCKNNQPCLLFQRFGYCAKYIEGTCPKVHDKKQVVLCKNFLQGKCHLDNCPLSHDVGPEKMPTCKYFLEGCCTRDNCQYLHVKVSANTPICVPFLRGYCAKGDQCKERHTNICPEFDKYGKCAKGKNCPYPHKPCLLQQQNTLRLPRASTSYKKPKLGNERVDISSHDDSKKRYYDDSCSTKDLETKKRNINKKIRVMTMVHRASENPDIIVITDDDEMKSQPITEEIRPRRPPIGPLPSYIPID